MQVSQVEWLYYNHLTNLMFSIGSLYGRKIENDLNKKLGRNETDA